VVSFHSGFHWFGERGGVTLNPAEFDRQVEQFDELAPEALGSVRATTAAPIKGVRAGPFHHDRLDVVEPELADRDIVVSFAERLYN
jgi:hypothetical protein